MCLSTASLSRPVQPAIPSVSIEIALAVRSLPWRRSKVSVGILLPLAMKPLTHGPTDSGLSGQTVLGAADAERLPGLLALGLSSCGEREVVLDDKPDRRSVPVDIGAVEDVLVLAALPVLDHEGVERAGGDGDPLLP